MSQALLFIGEGPDHLHGKMVGDLNSNLGTKASHMASVMAM